jgi:hypothetical protein
MRANIGTQRRVFRLTGVVSMVMAVVMVAADELLQYLPQGYASLLPWREIVAWRLLSGNALGVLAIPLSAIGYWQVCQALKLSGVKHTSWMFWIIAYGAALGAVSHGGIAACIVLLQQGASLTRAFDYLQSYTAVPFGVFLLCYLILSAWYCIVLLSRPTLYPKWMALLNPFLLSLVIELFNVSNVLPVVSNVLSPAWLSIPHLVFFTLSTLVLWSRREERVPETLYVKPNL